MWVEFESKNSNSRLSTIKIPKQVLTFEIGKNLSLLKEEVVVVEFNSDKVRGGGKRKGGWWGGGGSHGDSDEGLP